MSPKWTPELEVTALISLIYSLHNGNSKLDRQTCKQLEVDLHGQGITAEAARQRVQKLLRNFTPKTVDTSNASAYAPVSPTSTAPAQTSTAAGKKRKTSGTLASESPNKRAKAAASDDVDDQVKEEDDAQVKEEVVEETE
ncbi:MAG: hypothetical protein Q9225_005882 [Loekoesia sp. 1 TL-2023]